MKVKYFSDVSEGRNNNFDFLRFFLASWVILGHSFYFLYNYGAFRLEPVMRLTHVQFSLGGGAVKGFFLISGFLITRSWVYSKGAVDYGIKRVLRIVPALVVVLLFTIFVIGPIATTDRGSYFHNTETYRYFGFLLTKSLHKTDILPGVFTHNPNGPSVNGSLWTVRCEGLCYIMVAVLGSLGLYRNRSFILTAALISSIYVSCKEFHHAATFDNLDSLFGPIQVTSYFLVGMAFYFYRDRISYSTNMLIAVLAVTIATTATNTLLFVLPFVYAYLLFYAAFNPNIRLQHFAKHGDLSYGIYLYAFPIQQLLVQMFRPYFNAYTLTLTAFLLTAACAGLSWHFVEHPFLMMKPKPKVDASTLPKSATAKSDVGEPAAAAK